MFYFSMGSSEAAMFYGLIRPVTSITRVSNTAYESVFEGCFEKNLI